MESSEDYENSVSMLDVLHEQEALNEDAEAVLGGIDEENCSYSKGYRRQPLYACTTCHPSDDVRAGMCLACANNCHAQHNTVELFTKRNFRCDCGNSKFPNNACSLSPGKDELNSQNAYNQNFDGLYCTCHRPYPDLEFPDEEDAMIQCIVCEDWFHDKHLGDNCTMPPGDQFGEMICKDCVKTLPFIQDYTSLAVHAVVAENSDAKVDVVNDSKESSSKENIPVAKENGDNSKTKENECKDKKEAEVSSNSSETEEKCSRGRHRGSPVEGKAIFLPDMWRDKLCVCAACKVLYAEKGVPFLTDEEDTISFYEQIAKERARERSNGRSSRERSIERELDALNSVDRVTRTEMVAEYNTLSTELREYLRKFAENGKVVRGEDINEFFSGLKARKKMRGNDGMPPNTCK